MDFDFDELEEVERKASLRQLELAAAGPNGSTQDHGQQAEASAGTVETDPGTLPQQSETAESALAACSPPSTQVAAPVDIIAGATNGSSASATEISAEPSQLRQAQPQPSAASSS